jgi:hypothetical protein
VLKYEKMKKWASIGMVLSMGDKYGALTGPAKRMIFTKIVAVVYRRSNLPLFNMVVIK